MPFVHNHSVCAEVLAPQGWEAKDIAGQSNLELAKNRIDVREKKIRAACETSAGMRTAAKHDYSAKELLEDLNPGLAHCTTSQAWTVATR